MLGLLALVAWLARPPEEARDQVGDLVELRIGPVLYHLQVERVWRRDGEVFRARGASELTLAEVKKLRRLILDSPEGQASVLSELGITPQALESHRPEIAAGMGLSRLPSEVEPSFQEVSDLALSSLRREHDGIPYQLRLNGVPDIRLTSRGSAPYCLPWQIQADGRAWRSYSPQLSLAVAKLARDLSFEPLSPREERYPLDQPLDGRRYWSQEFWSDPWAFRPVDERLRLFQLRQSPGYAELARQVSFPTGGFSLAPDLLHLLLIPRQGKLAQVEWTTYLENGRPQGTCRQVLEAMQQAEAVLSREHWVEEWRQAGRERAINLLVQPTETTLHLVDGSGDLRAILKARAGCVAIIQANPSDSPRHWLDRMRVVEGARPILIRYGQELPASPSKPPG